MAEKKAFANWVLLILLFAIAGTAVAVPVCSVDSNDFYQCRSAVSGPLPAAPTRGCCGVVRRVDIPCLCGYKSYLPVFQLNPDLVFALPKKCGVKTRVPC